MLLTIAVRDLRLSHAAVRATVQDLLCGQAAQVAVHALQSDPQEVLQAAVLPHQVQEVGRRQTETDGNILHKNII